MNSQTLVVIQPIDKVTVNQICSGQVNSPIFFLFEKNFDVFSPCTLFILGGFKFSDCSERTFRK